MWQLNTQKRTFSKKNEKQRYKMEKIEKVLTFVLAIDRTWSEFFLGGAKEVIRNLCRK